MTKRSPNRLSKETSPYLLQHAHNPVDWYPWGKDAHEKAYREGKPIFLSIGYSACHWCHVMEKESFEDEATAEILNKNFVSIKVDREERPDLDHIYMSAVQAMTQHGGWPMSVFLTPDLQPFYGGTYFPPTDRMGLPSFQKVLLGIISAWKTRQEELLKSAEQLTSALTQMASAGIGEQKSQVAEPKDTTSGAFEFLKNHFDPEAGGFGRAPKFFHSTDLRLCLRHYRNTGETQALEMVNQTLDAWARGGIRDQLAGGFHRYSTDSQWLVPHFEKMLYDNALLPPIFLEAYQCTGNPEWASVARDTLDYVLREMTSPKGSFFSTQDADSEGVEGKFYVWKKAEIESVLDPDSAATFNEVFNVTDHGNWEENNILHRTKSWEALAKGKDSDAQWLEDSLNPSKRKLLSERSKRIAPFRDEKILLSWNGMMIEALAMGYQVLGDPKYLEAASSAARFIWDEMREGKSNHLFHCHKDGVSHTPGFLDDYACLINALVSLFESDFQSTWLAWAEATAKHVMDSFWDPQKQSFYFTAKDQATVLYRPQEFQDGAVPSATAMTITAFVRLGKVTGKPQYLDIAERALGTHADLMKQAPMASAQMIVALELLKNNSKEVVLVPGTDTEKTEEMLQTVRQVFCPNKVVLLKNEDNATMDLFQGRTALHGETTAYVCENLSCRPPVSETAFLKELLQ